MTTLNNVTGPPSPPVPIAQGGTGATTAAAARTALGLAEAFLQVATVVVTRAQLLALDAAANTVELVAAVAGSFHEVVGVLFMLDAAGTAYDDAAADGNLVVRAAGPGTTWAEQEADGLVDSANGADAADAYRYVRVSSLPSPPVYDATPTSAAIELANNGAVFTDVAGTGLSVLRVRVWYRTHVLDLSA